MAGKPYIQGLLADFGANLGGFGLQENNMAIEQIGTNSDDGAKIPNFRQNVISEGVATRQLTASESGSLCLYDSAAGVVYTLPNPVAGMTFDFMTSVKRTSNAHKVITKTIGSEFILGTIFGYTTDVTEIDGFVADGSADVALSHNGTTTGGDLGGRYTLTAISTTQWLMTGNMYCGTATPATPVATS